MLRLLFMNYLSIGYGLLVIALMLMVLWRQMARGKEINLYTAGIWLMVISIVAIVVVYVVALVGGVSNQVWDVLNKPLVDIFIIGAILAIQGAVQKKPSNLPWVKYGALVVLLIGIAFIVLGIFLW